MNKKLNVFLDIVLIITLSFIVNEFSYLQREGRENLAYGIMFLMFIIILFSWLNKLDIKKWVYYIIISTIFILGLILIGFKNKM